MKLQEKHTNHIQTPALILNPELGTVPYSIVNSPENAEFNHSGREGLDLQVHDNT
jgi:hypothetical protein